MALTKPSLLIVGVCLLAIATMAGAALIGRDVIAFASKPNEVSVPAGTRISVRLEHAISTRDAHSGDAFVATVSQPVVVDGKTVISAGTHANGTVVYARGSGRLRGVARLGLKLHSLDMKGDVYELSTNTVGRSGGNHNKRNAVLIGGGAGVGALIGGLAGGVKGLLIGAPVGAGAGLAGAAMTGKKEITLPAESRLTFRLEEPASMPVVED